MSANSHPHLELTSPVVKTRDDLLSSEQVSNRVSDSIGLGYGQGIPRNPNMSVTYFWYKIKLNITPVLHVYQEEVFSGLNCL